MKKTMSTQRHKGTKSEGGRRKAEGRMHCMGLAALAPSVEPHWQAWFWLGAMFGAAAWLCLRAVEWVNAEVTQERLEGRELSDREAVEAHLARQRARVLTESEHRELLLTALSDAMRNPLRRVDIRGIPALWPLTEAQRSVWLAWLRGKEMEWGGYRWTATVERIAHLVFVRFALVEQAVRPSETGKVKMEKKWKPGSYISCVAFALGDDHEFPSPAAQAGATREAPAATADTLTCLSGLAAGETLSSKEDAA